MSSSLSTVALHTDPPPGAWDGGPAMSTVALHTDPLPGAWDGGPAMHISPPITPATTFKLPIGEEVAGSPVYGRYGNPSRLGLEATLAAVEGAEFCLTFSSGMAASNALLSLLAKGEHLVCGSQAYGGVINMARDLPRLGVDVTFVNSMDPSLVSSAITPSTRVVWLEVCTNPALQILDLAAIMAAIHEARQEPPMVVVDNTFLSPWVVRPLQHGVDVVMHSCSKYLGGHSDVIMGALLTDDKHIHSRLFSVQKYRGAIPSPFDCFLLQRSLCTLDVRMERHMHNGLHLAKFAQTAGGVLKVLHPLLETHPHHELATRQNVRHSGMVTLVMEGGDDKAMEFLLQLKLVHLAASLGGVHSLACVPGRLTHAMCTEEEKKAAGLEDGMVRISVGLEDVRDIIQDVEQALQAVYGGPDKTSKEQ